jgi:hypothetical protein
VPVFLSALQRRPTLSFATVVLGSLLGFGLLFDDLVDEPATRPAREAVRAMARQLGVPERLGPQATQLAAWVLRSGDHGGQPFVIVDKAAARLFTFDGAGRLQGSTPVLLAASQADAAVTASTPAGRFVAAPAARGTAQDGLRWVNGRAELLLHAPGSPQAPGRAALRLASASLADKRISDGSLHVPPRVYADHLLPLRSRASVAYVLPEQAGAQQQHRGGYLRVGTPAPAALPGRTS